MATKKTAVKKAAPKTTEKAPDRSVQHAAVQDSLPDRDIYYADEATRQKVTGK